MKTFLKVLGTTALLASLVPFSHKKDEENDQDTYQALLWKVVNRPDPEKENGRKLDISIGFNNPFSKGEDDEAHLFADDLTVSYHTVPAAQEKCSAEAEAPVDAAEAPAEAAAEALEEAPTEAPAETAGETPAKSPEENA